MQRFVEFLKEVRVELSKISWPTREELREQTIVVIISVIVITVFIGAVDQVFNWMWRLLLSA
jgi:preprotein translocase subunit SecE